MEEANNKKRPAGSATTTGKRREQRQAKQWNTLQQANPPVTTAADMEVQLQSRSLSAWPRSKGSKNCSKGSKNQREQELKAKLASLKKEFAAKNSTGSSSSRGRGKSLKKDSAEPASLKKEKPLVIIDWHNTLEVNDALPEENLDALKKVLEVADVRIISWVNSEARRKSTLKQIRDLIPHETLKKVKGYQTIWYKCGEGGKVHWATHYIV
eukprot:s1514_g15.t1